MVLWDIYRKTKAYNNNKLNILNIYYNYGAVSLRPHHLQGPRMTDPVLEQKIIEHEGIKKSVYKDSKGLYTIGIGFLCDPSMNAGLSIEECMLILRSRIANLERQLSQYDWFTIQDSVRKSALIELAYNLGVSKLLTFTTFLGLMKTREVGKASVDLANTEWAKQVGPIRSKDICMRIREGSYNLGQ